MANDSSMDLVTRAARQEMRQSPDTREAARIGTLSRVIDMQGMSVQDVRNELAARGVTDVDSLLIRLDNRWQPPPPPAESVSPLYSDVEVLDAVTTDTKIKAIPTVAISTTADTTLDSIPAKWQFTDLIVGGTVAASGDDSLVEIQIVLGTRVITQFRMDSMRRTSQHTIILDALQAAYKHQIGPSSTVKVRVINGNSGVGQTFTGYLQYTFRLCDRAALTSAVQRMVLL